MTPDAVTLRTKDGRTATLHPEEVVRRLWLRVLPAGFVKLRHSGLFAAGQVATALPIAQRLLTQRPLAAPPLRRHPGRRCSTA